MERAVEQQFSQEVLVEAARRFGLAADSLKLLGDFENYVYEGQKDGTSYILRLTHSSHRSTNLVLGELEWINYLAENGVSVAKALHSVAGKLAEEIPVGEGYFVASFVPESKGQIIGSYQSRRTNPGRHI